MSPEVTDAYRRSFFKVYKNGRNGCLARYFRDIFQVLDWMLKSDNGPVSRCFLEYQPCFVLGQTGSWQSVWQRRGFPAGAW